MNKKRIVFPSGEITDEENSIVLPLPFSPKVIQSGAKYMYIQKIEIIPYPKKITYGDENE